MIPWEIVKQHPECEWSYFYLGWNPNINFEIINNNPNYAWDYCVLSMNNPQKEKNTFIQMYMTTKQYFRETITFEIIKKIFHPDHYLSFSNYGF